ncbi:Secretion protein HlyD, partial [mine drainage metagenome]
MPPIAKRLVALVLLVLLVGGALWVRHTRLAEKRQKDTLRFYGNIDLREVQVAFHDTGRIEKLLFVEGASVHAGELLALMDPVRYQDIVDADSRTLDRDRAQETNAQKTWDRVKRLTQADFNTRQQKDDARAALDMASAARKRDEAQKAFDERQLEDTKLYAPVDGIVQTRILEP